MGYEFYFDYVKLSSTLVPRVSNERSQKHMFQCNVDQEKVRHPIELLGCGQALSQQSVVLESCAKTGLASDL